MDLRENANLALHGISGVLNPEANYEFWWEVVYDSNTPYMTPEARSFGGCGMKLLESVPMMLVMTGNEEYNKSLNGLKNLLLSWIDNDGLIYCPVGPNRPWDNVCPVDWGNVYGQARMMIAAMIFL